jgi:hypothetical protein
LKEGIVARTGLQKGIKKADTFQYPFLIFFIGRSDWIRTSDFYVPKRKKSGKYKHLPVFWWLKYRIFAGNYVCVARFEYPLSFSVALG